MYLSYMCYASFFYLLLFFMFDRDFVQAVDEHIIMGSS